MAYRSKLDSKRTEKKLTIHQLAAAAGVSAGTVSAIVNGRIQRPTRRTCHRLAAALECSLAEAGLAEEGGAKC